MRYVSMIILLIRHGQLYSHRQINNSMIESPKCTKHYNQEELAISNLVQHSQMKTFYVDKWSSLNQEKEESCIVEDQEHKSKFVESVKFREKFSYKKQQTAKKPGYYSVKKIEAAAIKGRYKKFELTNKNIHNSLSSNTRENKALIYINQKPFRNKDAQRHLQKGQNNPKSLENILIMKKQTKRKNSYRPESNYDEKGRKMSLPWIKQVPKANGNEASLEKQQKNMRRQLQKSLKLIHSERKQKLRIQTAHREPEHQSSIVSNLQQISNQKQDTDQLKLQLLKKWVGLNKPGQKPRISNLLKQHFELRYLEKKRERKKRLINQILHSRDRAHQ